jgi:hypothetical protein
LRWESGEAGQQEGETGHWIVSKRDCVASGDGTHYVGQDSKEENLDSVWVNLNSNQDRLVSEKVKVQRVRTGLFHEQERVDSNH